MNSNLKDDFYDKLYYDKIKINWNKNPIRMDLFLSFLTVKVERSHEHFGSSNGWTKLTNEEHKLIIGGGIVGSIEFLDSIQYGVKLSNTYNNYVNPLYLFDIFTKEGQAFFLEYYADEIDAIVTTKRKSIAIEERKLSHSKEVLQVIEQEIQLLKSNC